MRQCQECSAEFAPRQSRHVFCSRRCKNRRRARVNPHPMQLLHFQARFFMKHPWIEKRCQARDCGETRIVELAHKVPRMGERATTKNTRAEDVWILCPTCHRLLDFKIVSASALGLARPDE